MEYMYIGIVSQKDVKYVDLKELASNFWTYQQYCGETVIEGSSVTLNIAMQLNL